MAHGVNEAWLQRGTSPDVAGADKKTKGRSSAKEGKAVGSRRIFSPQFKLRVLDSYRRDPDCRGNQRATARKYGIHRRQIQKWLQMESTLRCNAEASGVAAVGAGEESGGEVALNLASARQRDVDDERSSSPCIAGCLPAPETPSPTQEDEELNVDKVSDSEDDVSSNTSSLYDQDRALDFTAAALSKRRFFSLPFKLEVIEAFYKDPECRGNQRATARKFKVHRRQVQKWLNREAVLRGEAGEECLLDLSQKRKADPEEYPEAKRAALEYDPPEKPSSAQETALCLVKQPIGSPEVTSSSVDLYRPYDLAYSPPQPILYDQWCPPYCSYYSTLSTVFVTGWLNHEAPYYKQTLHEMHSYTMRTHS